VWSGPGHPASCCPTMGQPAASCLQESFDAAVKENQEEFGMEVLTFQSARKVVASMTSALCSELLTLNTLDYSKRKHSLRAKTQQPC